MKILVTGGGTGGHLSVAEALSKAATARGNEVIYVGSTSGQDRAWFEKYSAFTHTYFFNTRGVVNQKFFGKLVSLFNILKASLHVMKILRNNRVDAVISVGGYSASPASFSAILMRKPFYIQEQNAKLGRLNSLLKPYAKEFFSVYERRTKVKSYPVKAEFFEKARVREKIKTVIFLGGSQGATYINEMALHVAPTLQRKNIKIIHQCGKNDYERVKREYNELGIKVELYAFSNEIANLMSRADLAVSRAGASTLWELTSNALPTLFIPYPYAASDHQYYNALFIVQAEMGWCVRESEEPKVKLLEILDEALIERSKKLMKSNKKNSAELMIKIMEARNVT